MGPRKAGRRLRRKSEPSEGFPQAEFISAEEVKSEGRPARCGASGGEFPGPRQVHERRGRRGVLLTALEPLLTRRCKFRIIPFPLPGKRHSLHRTSFSEAKQGFRFGEDERRSAAEIRRQADGAKRSPRGRREA